MGKRFIPYNPASNNCQDFILAMLLGNNLTTASNALFVKQAVGQLFTPQFRKIANTITDVASKVDIIRQGGDIDRPKKINPWIQHVKIYASQKRIPCGCNPPRESP